MAGDFAELGAMRFYGAAPPGGLEDLPLKYLDTKQSWRHFSGMKLPYSTTMSSMWQLNFTAMRLPCSELLYIFAFVAACLFGASDVVHTHDPRV